MHTALTILLKSKKPLPVTVIAQAIAKMVMRTKAILITFRMTPFFMQSHSFINFKRDEQNRRKEQPANRQMGIERA